MPEISRFLGIIITMYWEAATEHHEPHFHVRYGDYQAVYSISPVAQLAGALPVRQQRLVEAWAGRSTNSRSENWRRLQRGQAPLKIKGLV